jgi:adenylate cyclase
VFAVLAVAMALLSGVLPGVKQAMSRLDWLLYDLAYSFRKAELRLDGPVVVIAADDQDLNIVEKGMGGTIPAYRWPWPRQFWGEVAKYVESHGAKAIVFDLQFDQPSEYNDELDDDAMFAASIDGLKMPAIFAVTIQKGKIDPLAPPFAKPTVGVASRSDKVVRDYVRLNSGEPSLADATLKAIGVESKIDGDFLLHFHGPVVRNDGKNTIRYLSAAKTLAAAIKPENAQAVGLDPSVFKGKIVIVGATAANTYDIYASPLDRLYPGVDSHATAIDNLLNNQRVVESHWGSTALAMVAGIVATFASSWPRSTWAKIGLGLVAVIACVGIGLLLFIGSSILWLPMAVPILASVLGIVGGFAHSFLTEDKARRHMTKALESYVSPQVTRMLERDPGKLSTQAEQREMTVMFTDLAGFTDFSEVVPVHVLSHVLNVYMDTMTRILLDHGATVDKYVGDQIMAFWNAPIEQTDHADRAAMAAIAIQRADAEIGDVLIADATLSAFLDSRPDVMTILSNMGKTKLFTRIGINSGLMNVGNMGSSLKFQYTVIGDAVNAAARLEPANKRYGTRILASGQFVKLLKNPMKVRKMDVLRVKGKKQATEVFTLVDPKMNSPEAEKMAQRYAAAFVEYQKGDWVSAKSMLIATLNDLGEDAATRSLLARVEEFEKNPPSPWDGVYTATEK